MVNIIIIQSYQLNMLSQWQQIKEQTFIIHHTIKRYIIVYVQHIMVSDLPRGREYGERSSADAVVRAWRTET